MADLSADQFPEFFEALWGEPPFAWQCELARRVINNHETPWPEAIALPTAAGKTACVDIAVFALAAGLHVAGKTARCRAPRRIFFVVDRRVIVDEAYERANELADKLRDAQADILKGVADALRRLAHGLDEGWEDETPLLAFQLRGGMYRSEAWARSLLQPIVVASTVDQVGSRLLFRAYGRGPGMWPVYAGLVANDSLIFLDEAHCAQPFLQTLQSVARYRKLASAPVPADFLPVVLSATPPIGVQDVFRDTSQEASDPQHPLGRRQLAHKPAVLLPLVKTSGKKAVDPFAAALSEQAVALAKEKCKAVVIFANRVATARATYALLREKYETILLTGRMRPFDKDDTVQERLGMLSAQSSETRCLERAVFVVATQTLEVGANLDFDALVTECASLDALRQRFGRLNRKGRSIAARAAILIREEQAKDSSEDPVYGAALARTWAWLQKKAGEAAEIDFGIAHLQPLLPASPDLEALNAPSVSAPVMLPAHLDVLAQTSPIPWPSPDVALFLHGPGRTSADVQVCWRCDLNLSDPHRNEQALDLLTYCPPASTECLPVPIWRFRRWLTGKEEVDESADVEGEARMEDARDEGTKTQRRVIRWRGRDDVEVISDVSDLRPGDVIVIPTDAGGWAALGDLAPGADGQPVLDWGDRAFRVLRARAVLRLHPALIGAWPIAQTIRDTLLGLITNTKDRLEEDSDGFIAELRDTLRDLGKQTKSIAPAWRWLPEIAHSLAVDRKLSRNVFPHPFGGLILRGSRPLPVQAEQPDVFSDEHDATASGTVPVPLGEHLSGVAEFARRFADGAALPQPQATAVELAGHLHDLGKADLRFQSLLRGGQHFLVGELLAKSGAMPQGRTAFERARSTSGYPKGGRHELLSVRLAENAEDVLPTDNALRELALHLVASHHGYCRPFAPVVADERPVNVTFELSGRTWSHSSLTELERLDSGISDRFWVLLRRHGWWGLAWLEALLRLADHRRSEWEQEHAAGENDA